MLVEKETQSEEAVGVCCDAYIVERVCMISHVAYVASDGDVIIGPLPRATFCVLVRAFPSEQKAENSTIRQLNQFYGIVFKA
jgi:hypothetical protein